MNSKGRRAVCPTRKVKEGLEQTNPMENGARNDSNEHCTHAVVRGNDEAPLSGGQGG